MRSSSIVLVAALVSAVPSIAAPVPHTSTRRAAVSGAVAVKAESAASAFIKPLLSNIASTAALTAFFAEIGKFTGSGDQASRRDVAVTERAAASAATKEVLDFLAGIIGSITGKAATNAALGNNIDGTPKTKRGDIDERSIATLLKPLLKSAASSAAVSGFFAGISSLFGGGDDAAPARRAAPANAEELIAQLEGGSLFTQEQLDEVESELQRTIGGSGLIGRDFDARALKVGGLTKGILGLVGSIAGSLGIDALFGNDGAARRAAPANAEELVAQIESGSLFTQEQLDEVESELQRTIGGNGLFGRDLETRALKLGGLTKGIVGLIGSLAGSLGIGALFGGSGAIGRRADSTEIDELIQDIDNNKFVKFLNLFGREEGVESRALSGEIDEFFREISDTKLVKLLNLLPRTTSLNELD